ncbi:hypothetical protein D3C76_1393120 [compost metagenome]
MPATYSTGVGHALAHSMAAAGREMSPARTTISASTAGNGRASTDKWISESRAMRMERFLAVGAIYLRG